MKNIKEDIRIFQDAKTNKLTIVCYNLSSKTKAKLIDALLGDIEAVETVENVISTVPDLNEQQVNTEGMIPAIDLDQLITGKSPALAVAELAKAYETTKQANIPAKIKELLPQVQSADDNSIRGVLYQLRNMSSSVIDNFAASFGYDISAHPEERDNYIIEALKSACRDTLQDTLQQMIN
ncbi:hypothetical protein [Butyrivibrio sp.]|uniref:hypothetical protein n=1 Tax=Butyrivibrio sp. TaxID=28121 RepID=UPI0025C65705|nr:hypothetical protein [Butyrivibrio sp.]MBQ7430218.1 hypothetical protein [Butyrivibrio sp.]MBQ9303392.1 hypothetical protein [Butyrivibrio sp.]